MREQRRRDMGWIGNSLNNYAQGRPPYADASLACSSFKKVRSRGHAASSVAHSAPIRGLVRARPRSSAVPQFTRTNAGPPGAAACRDQSASRPWFLLKSRHRGSACSQISPRSDATDELQRDDVSARDESEGREAMVVRVT